MLKNNWRLLCGLAALLFMAAACGEAEVQQPSPGASPPAPSQPESPTGASSTTLALPQVGTGQAAQSPSSEPQAPSPTEPRGEDAGATSSTSTPDSSGAVLGESPAPSPPPAILTYTENGFAPDRLEVDVGQVVSFSNGSDIEFWPASNIHPTHQIYAEFDAKYPIRPGEAWVFSFENIGFWRFHNHLNPRQTGIIIVRGSGEEPELPPLVIESREFSFKGLGEVSEDDALRFRIWHESISSADSVISFLP